MENQNMENNQGQQQGANSNQQQNNQGQNNQQSEKLFTQDDVNRIVQERLARYKGNENNGNSDGFSERERTLDKRERTLEARERLAEAGLPKELLDAVNCNSKDEMEKSIKAITTYFGVRKSQQTYRVSTGLPNKGSGGSGSSDEANIRKAMGLKG